ncbi:hypothetical protein HW132_02660 [Brasilonema sp. CT11]|nr:hypothetical protein [Brasilonema sp. CT11]
MLVSTFELLVKSQLPGSVAPAPPPPPAGSPDTKKLARTVVQGYFLTISNVNSFNVTVSLVFDALTPSISPANTIAIVDVSGVNQTSDLVLDPGGKSARFPSLTIPANDTLLLIFQPDILTNPNLLTSADFELRGFVQILPSSLSGNQSADLLLTPEQRGTFFGNLNGSNLQLDQIAYNIPTAHGGSLFRLSTL